MKVRSVRALAPFAGNPERKGNEYNLIMLPVHTSIGVRAASTAELEQSPRPRRLPSRQRLSPALCCVSGPGFLPVGLSAAVPSRGIPGTYLPFHHFGAGSGEPGEQPCRPFWCLKTMPHCAS